jgi:hypothetical protein
VGETLGLCWRHVDFETGLISIEQQADAKSEIARLKTESGYRRIEAPDWLLSMLRAARLASPRSTDDDLIFATRTGQPHRHSNILGRGLYSALRRAGLPQTSFHSLRHSHASLWIKDGGDVITLSRRLGHATPQVTMSTYADEIEEANDNAVRKARVNALFGGIAMAARMAASDGSSPQQTEVSAPAEVVTLAGLRSSSQHPAAAGCSSSSAAASRDVRGVPRRSSCPHGSWRSTPSGLSTA